MNGIVGGGLRQQPYYYYYDLRRRQLSGQNDCLAGLDRGDIT